MARGRTGKRERQARKRHRRARIYSGALSAGLKVGHSHYWRHFVRYLVTETVADIKLKSLGAEPRSAGGDSAPLD